MAKFSLKTDHFITPIKLVLPGIIVSLVGASAAFFLFNNPEKQKARQTYSSWNVIREYENAFVRGTEDIYCGQETFDQVRFRKDYSHLLDVLIHNLEDLKDDDVDMRLKAFLNLKLARYNDAKRLTETYLDTVIKLNQAASKRPNDTAITNAGQRLQSDYVSELAHIETRDTLELKQIAEQLNKAHLKYTDSFLLTIPSLQATPEINKHFMGRWRFPELGLTVEYKKDSSGTWEGINQTLHFTWTIKDKTLTMDFESEINNFIILEATPTKMSAFWTEQQYIAVGCRKGEAR